MSGQQSGTVYHQAINRNGLRYYQFSALHDTTHAVFTRLGGISPRPWSGLNLSKSVGDAPKTVSHNFNLACDTLGIQPKQTVACHLVHGSRAIHAQGPNFGSDRIKADALITQKRGLFLTMWFADCVPLLIYDGVNQAIGLAHAGWRGTMQNVISAVIKAMTECFGSRPSDLIVVMGPSIGPCCYQVGQDVFQAAKDTFSQPMSFFVEREQVLYFDMWATNLFQAQAIGVRQIIRSQICTACNSTMFFSHRAEKGQTGRFGVFLGLPER